ncbi:GrpB family protein [Kineococcus sp. T13]|uniref:GrpB family protein n=1 Tax=Kineococcus vitellinus TaxID=2696565 RepID=UPI00141221EE|nr:GrpB family protein [Kineococcus vitellinus]NAZ75602.1 GrpB family protein [Kineococcus vitellinus]
MLPERPDATVDVIAYDPAWPAAFEAERANLLVAWPALVAVEHIGSTAVPGLAAKPTIDVLAVVTDADIDHDGIDADSIDTGVPAAVSARVPAVIAAFQALGYQWVADSFADDPQHLFLHRLRAGKRTHHLHVVAASSPLVARYLLFRDYLRAHPGEAARYAAFKQDLATRYAQQRDRYVDAKPPFVDATIEQARRWGATGHRA